MLLFLLPLPLFNANSILPSSFTHSIPVPFSSLRSPPRRTPSRASVPATLPTSTTPPAPPVPPSPPPPSSLLRLESIISLPFLRNLRLRRMLVFDGCQAVFVYGGGRGGPVGVCGVEGLLLGLLLLLWDWLCGFGGGGGDGWFRFRGVGLRGRGFYKQEQKKRWKRVSDSKPNHFIPIKSPRKKVPRRVAPSASIGMLEPFPFFQGVLKTNHKVEQNPPALLPFHSHHSNSPSPISTPSSPTFPNLTVPNVKPPETTTGLCSSCCW